MRSLPRFAFPAFALLLAACGEPTPAAPPPQPTEAPTAAPAPPPPPEPTATASAAPSGSAAAAPAKPPKTSSGRPVMLKQDPAEITDTFGSTQVAKLELGDKEIATLRIPEGSLARAVNITFKLDARGKATGQQVGKIYKLFSIYPPGTTPEPQVDTSGDPFVLEMPAGTKKDANLAIGVEGDKGKVTWTIVAPKRIDDSRNVAIFELPALPSAWLHVTTKAPTAKK